MTTSADPMVSVMTPCHNAEATIAETIKSVINQTYRNWEMLIVDDSSTDGTEGIVRGFVSRDSRIRYFRTEKPSGSPALPRNIGLDHANGKYIAFLDSDDLWLPDKLKLQTEFATANGHDFVYSYYEKMEPDGSRNNRVVRTATTSTFKSLLNSNSIPCLTAMLSRESIGTTRFKQIPQEDFCFWLDILKKGYTAHNLRKTTALYRESRNSRSANKFKMFKGFWNVIHHHQGIGLAESCMHMVSFSILGFLKYLK